MAQRRERSEQRINLTSLSDQMLLELTQEGMSEAFGEMWSRHNTSAFGAARAFTHYDPNDLVQEAFMKVYSHIAGGGNIPISFRAYVATVVRNLAKDKARREPDGYADPLDEEDTNDTVAEDDFSDRVLEDSTTAQAFQSLPTRQREVLWYRDVEDLPVQEIARYLGMTPNSTTVAIKRARDAFKTAWISVQLSPKRKLPEECSFVVNKLAAHARGKLSAADSGRVDLHLLDCTHCMAVSAEANDLHKHLAMVLLPLLLLGGAPSYLEWIQSGKNRTPPPASANYVSVALTGVRRSPMGSGSPSPKLAKRTRSLAVAAATVSLLVVGAGAVAAVRVLETDSSLTVSDELSHQDVVREERTPFTPDRHQPERGVVSPVPEAASQIQASDLPDAYFEVAASDVSPVVPVEAVIAPSELVSPAPLVYPEYRELSVTLDPTTGTIAITSTADAAIEILVVVPRSVAYREVIVADASGQAEYRFPNHRGQTLSFSLTQTYATADGPVSGPSDFPLTDFTVPLS